MSTPSRSAFLREQRKFPYDELKTLAEQCDQAYIDVAQKVNGRVIGTYALGSQIVTGERWVLQGQPKTQQTLRQIYTFTASGNLPHGLNFVSIAQFTKCSGSFTDSTNYYGVLYAGSTAISGQVSFYVTPTDIVILSGAGAPSITSGTIILEWLSNY
jgi:hypothetical protein